MIKIPIHKGANSYKTRVVKIQNYPCKFVFRINDQDLDKKPLIIKCSFSHCSKYSPKLLY